MVNKQINDLEKEIKDNKWSVKFWKKWDRKDRLERLGKQKKELEEILLDRKEKAFLYFAFERSNNPIILNKFKSYYANVLDLRKIEKDWTSLSSNSLNWTDENEGFFHFNIYGFAKVIKNIEEIRTEDKKIDSYSDKAIYKIIGPNGEVIADDIQGEEAADKIYNEKTEEYKKKLEEEYNTEKENQPEKTNEELDKSKEPGKGEDNKNDEEQKKLEERGRGKEIRPRTRKEKTGRGERSRKESQRRKRESILGISKKDV